VRLRLRVLFAVLVIVPLGALVVFAAWASRNEEARAERLKRAVIEGRLTALATTLGEASSELERELLARTARLPSEPGELRALIRNQLYLGRLIVLGPHGELRFPPPRGPSSEGERRLVDETRDLWERGPLSQPLRDEDTGLPATEGWLTRRGKDGMGLCFWRQTSAGDAPATAVVDIPGAILLAELVARLPVTETATSSSEANPRSLALLDPSGAVAYRWGSYRTRPGARPLLTAALPAPLGAYQIAFFGPWPSSGHATTGILAGAIALGLSILGAGLWLYRESTRDLRQAAERVSFVNQVSHELKTPLTNVRMYAELLEDHMATDDAVGQERLRVVVSESQRLSRLITNILTFARGERGGLTVHPAPGCVDDIVRDVLAQFTPSFVESQTTIILNTGAAGRVNVDADALSQMLGNLLSNVEKYAPGRPVAISTHLDGADASITVQDQGPGIPVAAREKVFDLFVRLGGHAHEGVPGTGIGLCIARTLARLHGGDLRVQPTERGACLRLTFKAEAAS
jgi:signal transduction histidine kinase